MVYFMNLWTIPRVLNGYVYFCQDALSQPKIKSILNPQRSSPKQTEKLNGSKRSQHSVSLELVHISVNFSSYQTLFFAWWANVLEWASIKPSIVCLFCKKLTEINGIVWHISNVPSLFTPLTPFGMAELKWDETLKFVRRITHNRSSHWKPNHLWWVFPLVALA